jgi:farnesyl-diphosphate farnesyltransferase
MLVKRQCRAADMPATPRLPTELPTLLRGVSRSFYLSIRLLPGPLRRPVGVGYLLARATDTLADTAQLPAGERREKLEVLAAAIGGRIPAQPALADIAASFAPLQDDAQERALIVALPQCLSLLDRLDPADREDVRAVLAHITRGQALDVERFAQGPLVALQSAAQLDEYTYLVAGSVGEFWTALCFRHLPGFASLPREQMRDLGRRYGMGLQLVNILRDAGADLAGGRCYFPADELAAAGIAAQDITRTPARFAPVRDRWLARADRGLEAGMRYADAVNSRRVRAASALPALLGGRTLALLRADAALGLQHRVKVPRNEVRALMARVAFTLAGRASLQTLFQQAGTAR